MQQAIMSTSKNATTILAKDGVTWRFIPVTMPNFGDMPPVSLAMKSAKRQLKCVFEEARYSIDVKTSTTVPIENKACKKSSLKSKIYRNVVRPYDPGRL